MYSDQESSNGIFYEIDTVLIPPSYQKKEEMNKENVSVSILMLNSSLQSVNDTYIIYISNMDSI